MSWPTGAETTAGLAPFTGAETRPAAHASDARPFSVEGHLRGRAAGAAAKMIDRVLGLDHLQRLYDRLGPAAGESFPERALESLDIAVDANGAESSIPAAGPLVVVANHPYGLLDGLALLAMLGRLRPDVKVLGNRWLASVPPMRPLVVGVDVLGGAAARAGNAASMRAALAWLEQGRCLVAFPAGEVAHRVGDAGVSLDGAWHPHIATLAARSRATVVPVFIAGANRRVFRAAGVIHPRLRTALLPRELLARRRSRVRLTVGAPIPFSAIERLPQRDRAPYLKARTYLLASSIRAARRPGAVPASPAAIAPRHAAEALAADVERLGPEHLLAETGGLQVYGAPASMLPHVLPEIGRLREVAFRAVGEGTGHAADLDAFDAHYWHLFAWDTGRRAIAGAYRVGVTSEIVPELGAAGLYTRTLFDYDERLLDQIGPAIELGRSFVCEEYQRGFAPLLALWRGIGAFVARRPECRRVFGAVSISSRYDTLSRQLLVRFLSSAALRHRAARLVRPMRPLPAGPRDETLLETAAVTSLEGISGLLAAIEPDGKTVPVLVRQYLNLNARLLAFSVDPDFGDALDGLMLADLTEVPRAMLQRLMGADGAAGFLARHAEGSRGACPARCYLSSPFRPFLKFGSIAARSAR